MVKDVILIADDNKINRDLLSVILGDKYEYLYAENGEEVIDIIDGNKKEVNIILLDLNMPKIDGFEVLKALKEQHYLEMIPVVIISSENNDEYVHKAYEFGATDYITRPFDSLVVQHRVKNTLMMYSNQKRLVKLVENQILERERVSNNMINIFSNIIELRNHESGSHTLHVQSISNILLHELVRLTEKYNLSEADISLISTLAALHDVGKIKIPESILNKPGKLTSEEWELMKSHTIEGYDILCNANIEQDNKFMITAKEICRWHHEKYDGSGYPDGLKGDDIPISAQVVSLADVYDALTSVRCYKRAFTHEEAINMILAGECGEFNPILLKCLKNVSSQLKEVKKNETLLKYDYDIESLHIANEILENSDVTVATSNVPFLLELETKKRDFFEKESANGIQFEYDALTHKTRVINSYESDDRRKITLYSSENIYKLLSDEDWNKFRNLVRATTKGNPYVRMDALLNVRGISRWHKLVACAIWPENGNEYVSVVGQFTDIHVRTVNEGIEKVFKHDIVGKEINSLISLFDIVRVVDPKETRVYAIDKDGKLVKTNLNCYDIWNKESRCDNCFYYRNLEDDSWHPKLEIKGNKIYSALSRKINLYNRDFVVEIAFQVNDDTLKSNDRYKLMSHLFLLDFYRDSLTGTYNRTYLEDFSDNLEKNEAICLIDVNDFKNINDNYGHLVGDEALKLIAHTITDIVKDNAIAIRYGGDEFILLFQKVDIDDFRNYTKRIDEEVKKLKILSHPEIEMSVSIGSAFHINPFLDALSCADKEMYKQKTKFKEEREKK